MAKENLRIEELPDSVMAVECESWGMTDVLTECAFRVSESDFTKLLQGWKFQKSSIAANSNEYLGGPELSLSFQAVEEYSALTELYPEEFKNGGHFKILVNREHTKIRTSLYIE